MKDFKNPHKVQIDKALDLLEIAVNERTPTWESATTELRDIMLAVDEVAQQAKRAGEIYGKLPL